MAVASGKMSLTDLGASATQLLKDFAAELTGLGVDLSDMSQYVSCGEIAWDGPSLVVYLGVGDSADPGGAMSKSYRKGLAVTTSSTFFVQITRMTSAMAFAGPILTPVPDNLNDDGVMAMNDAGCLLKAAILIFDKYLDTKPGQSFSIGPVQSLGPNGGMAAMRIRVDLSLS